MLILTGGDPLMRRDALDLVRQAADSGLHVGLSPSATARLLQADFGEIKAAGVQRMSLSLDGATRETHDAFRGVSGTYDRTIEAVKRAHTVGLDLQINTTLTRGNVHEYEAFKQLMFQLMPAMWSVFLLVPTGRAGVNDLPDPDDIERVFEDMAGLVGKAPFAVKTTEGKIEMAQGGTLFLDEVGDIPLPLQVKLLRFLQERVVERIGGRKPIPVDTRIVCATHQNLDVMTAEGTFREDLYYRLAEIVVRIPSLAGRAGDAGLLARHFVTKYAAAMNPNVKGLAPDALAAVDRWTWPGNVRELENVVQRAVVLCGGRVVTPAHVMFDDAGLDDQAGYASQMENLAQTMPTVAYSQPAYTQPTYAQPASSAPIEIRPTETPVNLEHAVMVSEQQVIMAAIQSTESRIEAARQLGISPRTLRYKLAKLKGGQDAPSMAMAR